MDPRCANFDPDHLQRAGERGGSVKHTLMLWAAQRIRDLEAALCAHGLALPVTQAPVTNPVLNNARTRVSDGSEAGGASP